MSAVWMKSSIASVELLRGWEWCKGWAAKMACFVSLNSWNCPGVIYQAEDAFLSVCGDLSDPEPLRRALEQCVERQGMDSPHPDGAAVGYVTFEGRYRFEFFKSLKVLEDWQESAAWRLRKTNVWAAAEDERSDEKGGVRILPGMSAENYVERVLQAQHYIRQGDIYQVNLTHRFRAQPVAYPYLLFEELMKISPAPGAAFLDFEDEIILSSSPELYFKVNGNVITTRPIKGTRPRDLQNPLRDQQLAYELMTSGKELAELIMITDLMRNDLGKISQIGTVITPELISLKSFAQVHHLLSTVEGQLKPDTHPVDVLCALHPGGSISGAPKIRAVEIIQELEREPREHYTGAIGYFAFNGDAAFSMGIRTLVQDQKGLSFGVGSGITAESIPEAEYQETLHKARGMIAALESYRHRSIRVPAQVER